MSVRYYCDGCETQFENMEAPNPVGMMTGGSPTAQVPNIPLMVYETVVQNRIALCSWACLAAYAARKATTGIDWTFPENISLEGGTDEASS